MQGRFTPYFVQSKVTGGHFAFKTEKGTKPFENPMDTCIKIKLVPTDIVADVGAYVGEYSLYAARQGVHKVLSYEPTPQSFALLNKNKKPNMEIFNCAVVGTDAPAVTLYISKGIGVTNSIAKNRNKQSAISVKAIKYERAIQDATVVKIDVEGAEYGYNIIQPNLRAIILEFHPIVGKDWQQRAHEIMDSIESAGFTRIVRPHFKSGWSLIGCWEK